MSKSYFVYMLVTLFALPGCVTRLVAERTVTTPDESVVVTSTAIRAEQSKPRRLLKQQTCLVFPLQFALAYDQNADDDDAMPPAAKDLVSSTATAQDGANEGPSRLGFEVNVLLSAERRELRKDIDFSYASTDRDDQSLSKLCSDVRAGHLPAQRFEGGLSSNRKAACAAIDDRLVVLTQNYQQLQQVDSGPLSPADGQSASPQVNQMRVEREQSELLSEFARLERHSRSSDCQDARVLRSQEKKMPLSGIDFERAEELQRAKARLSTEVKRRSVASNNIDMRERRVADPMLAFVRSKLEDPSRRLYKSRIVLALQRGNHFHAGDVLELRLVPLDDMTASPTTVKFRVTETSEVVAVPLGIASIVAFLLITTM